MKSFLTVILLLILISSSALAADFKNLNVEQFEKMRAGKTNVVLDVRTQKEYDAGHIPGAVLIDWNSPEFEKKVAALDKEKTYLVHCAAGGRSAKAIDALVRSGFQGKLVNLAGGITAWSNDVDPSVPKY